jgi:hypothetical protein
MGSGGLSNLFSIWTFGMVAEVEMSPMSRSTMRQRSRSVPTVDAACWVTLSRVRPAGLHT